MKVYPTSIRLSKEQRRFLRQIAKAQKHNKIATVVKQLVDREMRGAA